MARMLHVLATLGVALSLALPVAADGGAELIAAAQQQQLKKVRKLLAAGVDVDSKTRYGATALFFACDKGDLELAELLLEHGADVDVTDTFYNATPLTWTLFRIADSPPHRKVALLLLRHGPADAGAALRRAAQQGDEELARAALGSGTVEPAVILAAVALAESSGHQEIADELRARVPAEVEPPAVEVAPEKLATYVGDYKEDIGMSAKVFLEDGELKIQASGQPALTLDATGEDAFTVREADGIDIAFQGRGGLIEGLRLQQGGRNLFFARVEEAAADEVAAAAPELEPLPEPERGPPIPWPRFRGTGAAGIGDGQGTPTEWDGTSAHNVRWKTSIPGLAHSSPIVWGDRVFVTTAVSKRGDVSLRTGLYGDVDSVPDKARYRWQVLALDRRTGEILWQRTASKGRPKTGRHLKSTHANPTPATDGRYLVVQFGSQGLYCYDLDGRRIWKKKQGLLSSGWFYDATYEWGFSSSPIVWDGKAVVQVDVQQGSFLAAYDLATGRELWKTMRDEIPTWGTPVVLRNADGGPAEVVTNGTTVRGYDADSGAELWRLGPNSEITVASPVAAGGVAYVTGGYPPVRPIYAVRPGGRGDLSLPEGETASPHVVWSTERGGTYIPTPVVYRGILYVLQNNGRLTAHDAATGEELYRERIGKAEGFSASPVAADGRLYFTSEEGTTYVVRAGETFELLATNELGEVVMTSPAVSDGLLVIRGAKHVYGLGSAPVTED